MTNNPSSQTEGLLAVEQRGLQTALDYWQRATNEGLYDLIPDEDDPKSLAGLFARYLNHVPDLIRKHLATPAPIKATGEIEGLASEKVCMDCGGHNPVWFAPNAVWNLVIGGPDAKGDPGGFYCPLCFIRRAEDAGIVPTAWELRPEQIDGEQPLQAGVEGVADTRGAGQNTPRSCQGAQGSIAPEASVATPVATDKARAQGQREGWAAAQSWLRERGAQKPPASLHDAAAMLADQMDHVHQAAEALPAQTGEVGE